MDLVGEVADGGTLAEQVAQHKGDAGDLLEPVLHLPTRRDAAAQLSLDLPQLAVQLAPHPDRVLLQTLRLCQPVLGRLLRRGCLLPLHGEDRPRVPIDVGVRSFRDALPARRDVLAEVLPLQRPGSLLVGLDPLRWSPEPEVLGLRPPADLLALLPRALGMHAGDSLEASLDLSHLSVEVLGERDALLEVSVRLVRSIREVQEVRAQLGVVPEQAATLASERDGLLQTSLGVLGIGQALADGAVHLLETAVDPLDDLQGPLLQRLAPGERFLQSGGGLAPARSAPVLRELQGPMRLHRLVQLRVP